ncbi:MAG TPA: outer membrane protein assembly factor BamE [Steroidobacteraceae bacterium]|jgi:outer membrane protein assembly factor BamE|nr:outer membrane protein assembly factor BamE [Steroidobacteraceae bacterium]
MIIPHRTRRRSTLAALATLLAALALGGCVYRIDVQQGNYLEGKAVDQLQVGMTRTQVRYLLGTPLVPDVFDKDRWDYLYYFRHGRHRPNDPRRLVVYFKDDKVTRFERINVPESAPQAPEEGAPIQKFPKI